MSRILDYCRAGGWLAFGASAFLVAASCGSEEDLSQITAFNRAGAGAANGAVEPEGVSRCVPGQVQTCLGVCEGFGLGHQVCATDGRSYGACTCPETAPIATIDDGRDIVIIPPRIDPGSQVPVDVPGGPPVLARIGASCTRDAQCGDGLECFGADTDSLGFGGPAGGYCTARCENSAECTAIDRSSTCGTLGGQQLCLRSCRSQTPAEGVEKCLARPELTCLSAAAIGDEAPSDEPQFGICVPRCQSDAGCAGRRCDLSTGLCSDEPRAGDPIGAACDDPEPCAAGLCLGASATASGLCSAFCTVGFDGCGFDGSESVIDAACLLPQVPSEGDGDRGLCFELCDTADDCTEPSFTCAPEPTRGRAGVCLPGPANPGPSGPANEDLAQPCEADGECADGLSCLTSDSDPFAAGGGPAGGYCSAPCDSAAACPSGAVCVGTPGGGYCLRACEEGAPDACGRETALCADIGGIAVCLPNCTADDECGERACDPGLGLCVDAPDPVECVVDDDCAEGLCDAVLGECVPDPGPEPECVVDDDCAEGVCDVALGQCVPEPECVVDDDCAEGVCDVALGECVAEPAPGPECVTDEDCTEGVCDVALGQCVPEPQPEPECVTDEDCAEGVCDAALGQCVPEPAAECSSDADCPGAACDLATGTCTEAPPTCSADADCSNQVCSVLVGICIDPPPLPIGAVCSEDAQCSSEIAPENNTFGCLGLGTGSFCSAVCVLGTALGCEPYGPDAFCALRNPSDPELGFCLELCNLPEDCEQSGFECRLLNFDLGGGRFGVCLPPP